MSLFFCVFFFFNDTATTEIYTLSLHDALPISARSVKVTRLRCDAGRGPPLRTCGDRKSTRLTSSHQIISYAVFCLKKQQTADQRQDHRAGQEPQQRGAVQPATA